MCFSPPSNRAARDRFGRVSTPACVWVFELGESIKRTKEYRFIRKEFLTSVHENTAAFERNRRDSNGYVNFSHDCKTDRKRYWRNTRNSIARRLSWFYVPPVYVYIYIYTQYRSSYSFSVLLSLLDNEMNISYEYYRWNQYLYIIIMYTL